MCFKRLVFVLAVLPLAFFSSASGSPGVSPVQQDVIAFTSERTGGGDIYTMDSDGGNLQRLTDDPAYDAWPTWSPDGSRIAFVSTRSGNPDIHVMDPDGTDLQQLTDHAANDFWPEWSPDGTRIAFTSDREGSLDIYVMHPDGSNLQRLTDSAAAEDFPAWSPDGLQIVFSRVGGSDGTYIMNSDGSGEHQILDFPALEPDWSPDGARIAFGSDHEGFRAIYVVNVDGTNLQKLSDTYSGDNCPDWSHDGAKILFASWRDGNGEIYVMGANGTNLQRLTNHGSQDEFPTWQPADMFIRTTEGPHVNDNGMSMGVSWVDYDKDDYPDLFVPVHNGPNRLFRNNGDGSYSEAIGSIIVDDDSSNCGCWADFDNDGDLDAYVANGLHENALNYYYLNTGDGSFTKITDDIIASEAAASMAAVCADFNMDGSLDIFTSAWLFEGPSNAQLYQGAGDGTFTKITEGAVVEDPNPSGTSYWTDYDDDGDQDLLVSKAGAGESDVIYVNEYGQFTAETGLDFLTVDRGQDFTFADLDNDGDQDLFIPTWEGYNSALFENTGSGTFVRVTDQPIVNDAHWSTASCAGDFDNDGDLDIFLVNDNNYEDRPDHFYDNDGTGYFTSYVDSAFVNIPGGFSCKVATADYDRDGDLDLYVVNWYDGQPDLLYRNIGNNNNWMVIMPEGTVSNRSAIGSKVRLFALIDGAPVWQMREIRSHSSARSQSPFEAHFGLGDAGIADSILVEWPSGYVDTLVNVDVNQFVVVIEGQSLDLDGDGILGVDDNCPLLYNPGQVDGDGDSIGDVCDPFNNCGDPDGSDGIDIDDVVYLINYIFSGGPEPDPSCVGDASGDSTVDIDDVVHLINYIFGGGPAPVEDCCVSEAMIEIPLGAATITDGNIDAGEWDDALLIQFGIDSLIGITVMIKHDGNNLLAAYHYVFEQEENLCFPEILIDVGNDKSMDWMSNDWWFHVSGTDCEAQGVYDVWDDCSVIQPDWEGVPNFELVPEPPPLDTFEIRLPFSKLGINVQDTIGLAFRAEWVPSTYAYWPMDAAVESPGTWSTGILKP